MSEPRTIHIGHSPDPDDAFMFHALTTGLLDTPGFRFKHVLLDIESLNHAALQRTYEVSAISIHSYPDVAADYALMNCGASMGEGYGPMVVARPGTSTDSARNSSIAIPGLKTSAHLALKLAWGAVEVTEVSFDEIIPRVKAGEFVSGVIIHEGQLTYGEHGLECLLDFGIWWQERTGGLPLPLGGNIIRRDLGAELMEQFTAWVARSIEHSLANPKVALEFARQWGRGIDEQTNSRFVQMYVNQRTLDYGPDGRESVRRFLREGQKAGMVDEEFDIDEIVFVGA